LVVDIRPRGTSTLTICLTAAVVCWTVVSGIGLGPLSSNGNPSSVRLSPAPAHVGRRSALATPSSVKGDQPARTTWPAATGTNAYSVASTLVLANNTRYSGYAPVNNGVYLTGIAIDPSREIAYAASYLIGTLCEINLTSGAVFDTISLGPNSGPEPVVFDAATDEVYVGDTQTGYVSVVNAATNTLSTRILVGGDPQGLAWDPTNGNIYEISSGTNMVSEIDPTNHAVTANLTLQGTGASGWANLVYDSTNHDLYVADGWGGRTPVSNVSVIDPDSVALVTTISLSGTIESGGMAYDPANDDVYLAAFGANSVYVINASSNQLAKVVPAGTDSIDVAYDPSDADVYVTNWWSSNVTILSGGSNTLLATVNVPATPYGIAYDSANGEVLLVDSGMNALTAISGTTLAGELPIGSFPSGIATDPANGDLYVIDAGFNWALGNSAFASTWNPTGGAVFVLNGSSDTVVARIPVGSGPNSIAFDPSDGDVFVCEAGSGDLRVIDAATQRVVTALSMGTLPSGVAYDPSNGYVYVSGSGYSPYVTVVNGANLQIVATIPAVYQGGSFNPSGVVYDPANQMMLIEGGNAGLYEANGTSLVGAFSWSYIPALLGIAYDSRNGDLYVANDNGANVTVLNATTGAELTGIPVGSNPGPVAFDPSTGDLFVLNVGSSNVSVIDGSTNRVTLNSIETGTFYRPGYGSSAEPDGLAFDPDTGDVFVADYWNGSVSTIVPPNFTVAISETGLSPGTSWSVTLNGSTLSGTDPTLDFAEPRGTYGFSVAPVPGYSATPSSGSVSVTSYQVSVTVRFTPVSATTYPVTFTESGLPTGLPWLVSLGGSAQSSSTSTAGFTEPNGTYAFSIWNALGYTATPGSGSLSVDAGPASQAIDFTVRAPTIVCGPSATLDFDSLNATAGAVNASAYLASYGITVSGLTAGTEVVALDDNVYGGHGFVAPSAPNVLTQTGSASEPLSYTLNFPCPVSLVQFTRPYLIAYTTGQIFPGWTATAYDLAGASVGSVGQPLIDTFQNTPAATFNISGSGITSLRFDSNAEGRAGYGAVLIDDLVLSYASVYEVNFSAPGLPSGTNWSVTLTASASSTVLFTPLASVSVTHSSGGNAGIQFFVSNGTYSYTASAPGRTLASGSLTVDGSSVPSTKVSFAAASASGTTIPTLDWVLIGAVIVVLAVGIIIVLARRGGRPG
jgi:YVTN family beta-propeller protein